MIKMKISSIFKYIFIIFAIGIIIYAGYKIYQNDKNNENEEKDEVVIEDTTIKDIRLGLTSYDTMNPLITNNKEILNIDSLIYEPLFKVNEDYSLEPCLATECSKTGDRTYIVKVNTGINWQDGTSFISKDIQFTIDTIKQGNSIYKYNVTHIEQAEVIDASTIKLILDGEIPFFEYNLTFPIMSSSYYYGQNFYESDKIPIGTGRFKIADISSNSITLARNIKWKAKNEKEEDMKLENIKINLYSSMGEAYNAFKIGNIDLLNTSNQNFSDYIGTIGFTKNEYRGRQFDFLSFNCTDTIMQDIYVRKAISYAIDKDNIVSSVYANKYDTAEYPLDYGNYLYEENGASSGYNIEQARATLENGGWEYSNNKWKKEIDGYTRTLRLKIAVNKNNADRVAVAENIKEQLENIGISVTINKISEEQYSSYIENKDYQILLTGVYTGYSPDLTYYFGNNNLTNYFNDDMIKLVNNAGIIRNESELKEIYKQIYSKYKEDVPFIGLYRNKNITISSTSLVGTINANNYSTFYGISEWYRK